MSLWEPLDPFPEMAMLDEPAHEMRVPVIHIQPEAVWVCEVLTAQCPNAIRLILRELSLAQRNWDRSAGKG